MRFSIFVFLYCLLVLAPSCSKVEAPKFVGIKTFKVGKITLKESEVLFSVAYFNPNSFGVNVKEADIDVFLDSTYIGKFSQPDIVEAAKKSEFLIPLKGTIPISKMLQINFQDMLNKEVLVNAVGAVSVGKAGVYVKEKSIIPENTV